MKKSKLLYFASFVALIVTMMPPITAANENPGKSPESQVLREKRRTTLIAVGGRILRATIADSEKNLTEGLLGWNTITDDDGMLLDFTFPGQYAIHMQGMKFAIDALWIDPTGVIKLIYKDIRPNSGRVYPSLFSCRYCLEINAGFCEKYGVKEGAKVHLGVPAQ